MSQKNLFNIFLIFLLINSISSSVLVKAGKKINFSCEKDILYISIDVIFSEKPEKEFYPFVLTLNSPENLQFKCMLQYEESKINCLHAFSYEDDYIEEKDLFKFPISFPAIEGITWDYKTFLNEVFRRIYHSKFDCGVEKSKDVYETNIKWDLEGSIIDIKKGSCQPASKSDINEHRYYFDLIFSFSKGNMLNDLNNNDILLLQDIWIPLITERKKYNYSPSSFAFCSSNEVLNKNSAANYKMNCYIPIKIDSIFNDVIKFNSFFDKVYIKKGNKLSSIDININIKETEDTLIQQEDEIICPNLPVFTIEDKDSIIIGEFNLTKLFTFYLIGTISNGYYTFKNGTRVELSHTYKDIKFNLIIQDNFIDSEENDVQVECVLPEGTPYDDDEEAIIKCTGKKTDAKNVDIILNWNLKDNNNFDNIIITWPKSHDAKRKNLYGYELRGISIKQSDFGCRENYYDFYVYIYYLGREPKLSFDMPLSYPKNKMANCILFDKTALKCSLNLKHNRASKGTKIQMPEKGVIYVIETLEGNKVHFLTDNFTMINNEHDLFIKTKETCGDYLVVGALKDMGMSHKSSVITYIIIVIVVGILVLCASFYIAYACKLNYDRGTRLTLLEESKNNANLTKK